MLPPPTLTFTIPSIHDDTVLDCRIYHPESLNSKWEKKAAIVAHPYAPLGGCYDDPVVDIVASVILKQGFVLGTFNFRGAGSSKGRTSWTSKPEKDDYMSFVGFMAYYLQHLHSPASSEPDGDLDDFHHSLTTIPSQTLPAPQIDPARKSHASPPRLSEQLFIEKTRLAKDSRTGGLLLLAGYSYGSLITTHIPPTPEILTHFSQPDIGSAASEIRLRAEHLAKQQSELLASTATPPSSSHRGRFSLQIDDPRLAVPHSPGVRVGGEETNPGVRRSSQEGSRRSLDSATLRRSLDRVRSIGSHNLLVSPRYSSPQNSESPSPRKATNSADRSPGEVDHGLETFSEEVRPSSKRLKKPTPTPPTKMEPIEMIPLKTAYLLISPLRGIVKDLATMSIPRPLNPFNFSIPALPFSPKPKTSQPLIPSSYKLAETDTLAIFGSTDAFTSAKKLRSWATKLEKMGLDGGEDGEGSRFRWREVDGAGHFWHDREHVGILREEVREFVRGL